MSTQSKRTTYLVTAMAALIGLGCYGSSGGVYVGVAVPGPWYGPYGPYRGGYYPPATLGPPYIPPPEDVLEAASPPLDHMETSADSSEATS